MIHKPVLLKEVLQYLNPRPNQNLVDCTIGGGGHSFDIFKKTRPKGKILGIDWNQEAIEELKLKFATYNLQEKIILVNDNFIHLKRIVTEKNFYPIHGILFDLGLSSDLLERSKRGFTFQKDEILDMRFNLRDQDLTAQKILNEWPAEEIFKIFKEFGEEKFSKQIVQEILKQRQQKEIQTTQQLVNLIKVALGRRYHIKSVARIFQALRISVNKELENLEVALSQAINVLIPTGRLIIISYHSLEDRIAKRFLKNHKQIKILTKKPICPTKEEVKDNPRSRSAKLRAAEKIYF